MLPKQFKPKYKYNLIRIGRNNDGGYLVEKDSILKSNSLVSFGMGFDWSFEKDFFNYRKIPIHCYDHTIKYSKIKKYSRKSILNIFNKKFWSKKGIKLIIENFNLSKNYKKFFSGNIIILVKQLD